MEEGNLLSVETTFKNYEVEIGWDITMRCNYSCSYCSSYDNHQPTYFKSLDEYEKAIIYLKKYLGNKKAKIELLGGEPMLYKNWDQLLNIIYKVGYIPKITTNLSLNEKTLKTKINKLIPKSVIHVSWHSQFVDTQEMLSKIKILNNSGHLFKVSLLGDTRYWDNIMTIYNTLKNEVNISISEIHDETSSTEIKSGVLDYSEEQIKLIKEAKYKESDYETKIITKDKVILASTGNDFFEKGINNFKGMNCEIGTTRFHIHPNGNVLPSACLSNYQKAVMGNIYKENLKKINKPIICPFNFCGCGPDIRIKKYA